jgi:hypothetical protein
MSTLTPEQLSNLLNEYRDRVINKTDPDFRTIVGVKITTTVTYSDGSITEFDDIHSPTEELNRVRKKPAPTKQETTPYRSNCFPDDK